MSTLSRLATLLQVRNAIDDEIAALIGRPALRGHIGEFIAATVFGIRLNQAANERGFDGWFETGTLAGRSVDVKCYGKQEGLLDMADTDPPDFYLVLAGPRSSAVSSRGATRPFTIDSVHIFESKPLVEELRQRGVKIGTATSLHRESWHQAEVFPTSRSPLLEIDATQREALGQFASVG